MSFPAYPSYKESGVEWLDQIPDHWEVKRIRRIAKLNPSKVEASHLDRDAEVSFLPMESIGEDGGLSLDRTRAIGEVETGYTYFADGDITIAKITPCFENGKGAVMQGLVGGVGFGTTELIVVRPNEDEISSGYLQLVFASSLFRQRGEASMYGAGGQKRVPDDFVREFEVPLPPRSEQNKLIAFIGAEIAKIDALIQDQERLINLLLERQSGFVSKLVTQGLNGGVNLVNSGVSWLGAVPSHWKVLPIKRIVESPVTDGPHETPAFVDSGIPFVSAEAVSSGVIDFEKIRGFITESEHLRYSQKYKPRRDDIFMVKSGATTGVSAIVETDTDFNIWSPLAVIRCGQAVLPRFALHFIRSKNFKEAVELGWSFGTQQNIGMGVIENLSITVPPIEEQEAIVKALDEFGTQVNELIRESREGIKLMSERKNALISAAVTGKIDVRGFVPPGIQ